MYNDLSNFWIEFKEARVLHEIQPTWEGGRLHDCMYRRYTHTVYHNLALGRGPIRAVIHRNNFEPNSRLCRHGCLAEETLEHVLLHCTYVAKQRSRLKSEMGRDKDFTIQILLAEMKWAERVEHLIAAFLKLRNL